MNNLDKMKQSICTQIQEMDAIAFYEFITEFEESTDHGDCPVISVSEILTCQKCKELYGSCNNDFTDECKNRFKKYCEQEV